ncbi:MAG TPA: LLM class F420-dependent oxidoreductase [Acidimicrobiales bacterium]|nr:LLM class F420-dependent oxidoreductase [Acidimicrobiales bacterium]
MSRFQVGVQLHPQHCTIAELRQAWRAADELGVDSIWVWDHFFPLYGGDGPHFEGWSLLGAMAVDTHHARFGALVTCNSYRNPDLVADMARTVDQLSGGRLYLGMGAGWFERDYDEYGYRFGTAGDRLRDLESGLHRIRARLAALDPGPAGPLPIMVGGGGERVTLRITAEQADAWNSFGPPDTFAHKNRVLDHWCAEIGRDPGEIERTVAFNDPAEIDRIDDYLEAGATHVILGVGHPFALDDVSRLLDAARG